MYKVQKNLEFMVYLAHFGSSLTYICSDIPGDGTLLVTKRSSERRKKISRPIGQFYNISFAILNSS